MRMLIGVEYASEGWKRSSTKQRACSNNFRPPWQRYKLELVLLPGHGKRSPIMVCEIDRIMAAPGDRMSPLFQNSVLKVYVTPVMNTKISDKELQGSGVSSFFVSFIVVVAQPVIPASHVRA